MNLTVRSIVATAALTFVSASAAEKLLPFAPTAEELARLPDYCQARLAGNKDARAAWSRRIGHDIFAHLHHYCGGLNFMSRAETTLSVTNKKHYLTRAINEFNYSIARWPDSSELKKHAMAKKAQAELMLSMTK